VVSWGGGQTILLNGSGSTGGSSGTGQPIGAPVPRGIRAFPVGMMNPPAGQPTAGIPVANAGLNSLPRALPANAQPTPNDNGTPTNEAVRRASRKQSSGTIASH